MIMLKNLAIGLVLLGGLTLSTLAVALPPSQMTIQGQLKADGAPAPGGDYDITIRLWNAPFGGTKLFAEALTGVTVSNNGVFDAQLGKTVLLPPAIFVDNSQVWLGISVEAGPGIDAAEPELPRTVVTSVGFAFAATTAGVAGNVDCVGGPCISAIELDFDPATQAELDAVEAMIPAGLTSIDGLAGGNVSSGITVAGDVVAQSVDATSVGASSVVADVVDATTLTQGGNAVCDASGNCAAPPQPNELDSVSNGLLTNEFDEEVCSQGVLNVSDGQGLSNTLTFPDVGTAQSIVIKANFTSPGMNATRVAVTDPQGTQYVLWCGKDIQAPGCDGDTSNQTINTSYPNLTPTVSGDLLTLVGTNIGGTWTMTIEDHGADGEGAEVTTWCVGANYLSNTNLAANGNLAIDGAVSIQGKRAVIIRQMEVFTDSVGRTVPTSPWTQGPTFPVMPGFQPGSRVRLTYHVPARNDLLTSWGGLYIEPQMSFDGGMTWNSLGSSGYDGGVMNDEATAIGSYFNQLLIDPQQNEAFDVQVRFYYKAYSGSTIINDNHDINNRSGTADLMPGVNGQQHYTKVIVEELY